MSILSQQPMEVPCQHAPKAKQHAHLSTRYIMWSPMLTPTKQHDQQVSVKELLNHIKMAIKYACGAVLHGWLLLISLNAATLGLLSWASLFVCWLLHSDSHDH